MSDVVIDVRNLTRIYHAGDVDVPALRGVSLRIERGEFVAIVGSSGSGKSTLMAILGCLDRPTSGQYIFEGVDVAGLSEPDLARIRSQRMGFVFQTFNLLARTSAIENVSLPLFYAESGPSRRTHRLARARAALQLLGLGDREANTPAQLSGGQQQRVAIARALINRPSLLLADEPTGNVDTRTSHDIMRQLVTLNREQNVTIVVVTHEPDIAAYADRVITVRDGEIVSDERKASNEGSGLPKAPVSAVPTTMPMRLSGAGASWAFGFMVLGAAVQALRRNLLPSVLTMLGVFIGVAALIAMVAVGQGANEAVKKQIASLGTNLLVVMPGATTATGVRAGSGSASTLTVVDAQAIRREDAAVAQVSYLNRQTGQVQYANQNWTTQIQGVSPNYLPITNWDVAAGRAFTEEDENNTALVVVLGQTVYQQVFSVAENPVGATILVKGVPMRVIGLFVAKGQNAYGQDQDDLVMIPFTTAERKVLGVAGPTQVETTNSIYVVAPNPFGLQPRITGYVHAIFVQATRPDAVQAAIHQVTETLVRRHHIKPGDTNDFSVRNLSQIADVMQGSSRIMALLLAAVGVFFGYYPARKASRLDPIEALRYE